MDKVAVLMSTYNGEKYIEQQIESIFKQIEVEVELYIRDDGSSDNTIKILEKLKRKYNIHLYIGEKNLRPAYSFLEILKKCKSNVEFYSYADQDDVWLEDKLIGSIEKLKLFPKHECNLYASTYSVVDKDLNFLYVRDLKVDIPVSLESTIIDRSPSGCTMLFNKNLKDKIVNSNPNFIRMHDYWTLLTAEIFNGNIYIDDKPTMLYRQHDSNSVGTSETAHLLHFKRLIRSSMNSNERLRQAKSLMDEYGDEISQENRQRLKKITDYKNGFYNKFRLIIDKNYKTVTLKNNVLFKLSILLGIF